MLCYSQRLTILLVYNSYYKYLSVDGSVNPIHKRFTSPVLYKASEPGMIQ